MIEDMFDTFGDDPRFQSMINKMVDKMVIETNNELKFGKRQVNDDLTGATLLICIRNQLSFEFLRTVNMCINGSDETTFANVTNFINQLEMLYLKAEENKEECLSKKDFGG